MKSWDRAQAVIIGMIVRPGLRVACVREVQNTLKESVYQLLADTIQRLEVGHLFDLVEGEIRGPGGSKCIFVGMKDQNAESIKSLEGFDVVWWEEAQTASQRSLDVLRPTIRKPGSEIWFTWNPRSKTDPVDKFMRQANAGNPDFIVVEAQWYHNPWFSDVLEKERQLDLAGDPDRYAHIWEGAYEAESDYQFIGARLVQQAQSVAPRADISDEFVIGVDVARFGDDRSVIWMRRGRDARTMPPMVLDDKPDTMQLAGLVASLIDKHTPDAVFVDEGGVGGGVVDRLHQLGYGVLGINFGGTADRIIPGVPKCKNKRTQMWATMREWMRSGGAIPANIDLEVDLTGPLYTFDAQNAIQLEKKSDMKKRGVRSPDMADALALTFAYPAVGQQIKRREEARQIEEYDPYWSR